MYRGYLDHQNHVLCILLSTLYTMVPIYRQYCLHLSSVCYGYWCLQRSSIFLHDLCIPFL